MNNKIVLITGATSGIGKQTAKTLAKMGAWVFVTGRNQAAGETAVAEIKQASGSPQVDLLIGDLSVQAGVLSIASQFKARSARLDVLINNAGNAASARTLTPDGIESNFAINVVAPFMLTHLLMESLNASLSARVITLMGGDIPSKLELDYLQSERSFDGLKSYSQSKLAMMALMVEFAQRMQGTHTTINVCYPGQASTNMTRSVTPEMLPAGLRFIFPIFKLMTRPDGGKSAEKASRSSVYLANAAEVKGVNGKYFDTSHKLTAWPKAVLDQAARQQIWTTVERLSRLA